LPKKTEKKRKNEKKAEKAKTTAEACKKLHQKVIVESITTASLSFSL